MNTKAVSNHNNPSGFLAKKLGIGSFFAAAVFLFNPVINIVDILPDFFGYLLLLRALSKWSDLCPAIADAVQGLRKLRWFMLLKMFAMILIPYVDDTYVLVLTFGFAVIELIYMIPAIGRIFDGFEYLGTRYNGKAMFANMKNVRTITYMFFYAKILLPVVPELCSLSDYEYNGYVTSGVQTDFAKYKSALLIFGFIMTLLIGIMWLVNILPYFKRIGRESGFLSRVSEQYDIIITNNYGITLRRALYSILWIISAGFIFLLNVWVDEVNVIPNFLGGIFLIIAALKIKKITVNTKMTFWLSIAFTVISAVSYAASLIFSLNYTLRSIEFDFQAYDLYNLTKILTLLEYAVMFSVIFLLIRELRKIIAMYLGPDSDTSDIRLVTIYTNQQKELDRKFLIGIVLFVISFTLNLANIIFRVELAFFEPAFWIIAFIASGIWWIYMKNVFNQLYEQVDYKYL